MGPNGGYAVPLWIWSIIACPLPLAKSTVLILARVIYTVCPMSEGLNSMSLAHYLVTVLDRVPTPVWR